MTNAILEALVGLLTTHTWTSTTPKSVVKGAIPDALEYPFIGVLATGGQVIDETLGEMEAEDQLEVTIAMPVDIDAEDANTDTLLAMRDESIAVVYDNQYLGLEGTVRSSRYLGWSSSFASFTRDMGETVFFQYLTIRFSVRYAQDLD